MNSKGFFSGKFLPWLMFLIGTRGGVLVLDVHRVDFAANLGVAFVDDWVFLADGVVGNEKV